MIDSQFVAARRILKTLMARKRVLDRCHTTSFLEKEREAHAQNHRNILIEHHVTGRCKADTLGISNKHASKEQFKIVSKQLVMKFKLQVDKLPTCLERRCWK